RLAHLPLHRRLTDGVDLEHVLGEADVPEEADREVDLLEIRAGLGRAAALEAPLPELAVSQQLRTLSAEHRLPVRETLRRWRAMKTVLAICEHDAAGPLR